MFIQMGARMYMMKLAASLKSSEVLMVGRDDTLAEHLIQEHPGATDLI